MPNDIHSIKRNDDPIFKPIFGKVVIKIDKQPERKYGSLYLPQKDRSSSTIGKVHAVYEGTETSEGYIEPQVSVGDTVIFGQFTGTALEMGKDLYVVCREHDLLTIIEFPGEKPIIEEVH